MSSQSQNLAQKAALEEAKKNKRRSKKDKHGRNFICGCGKQYLSYPALYTHVKTKHNGLQPQGTKNHLALNNKRGRPKKQEPKLTADRERSDESLSLNQVNRNYLDRAATNNAIQYKYIVEKSDLVCLRSYSFPSQSYQSNPTIGFPVPVICDEGKPVFHPFNVIINQLKLSLPPNNFLAKNPSCDVVISLFLNSLSKLISEKFYVVLNLLFRNLRECLNDYGYDAAVEYCKKNEIELLDQVRNKKQEGRAFCEAETCQYVPLISETFINEYLPEKCPGFELQLAIDTMYDFCNWLAKKRFTKIKVRFGDESQIPK